MTSGRRLRSLSISAHTGFASFFTLFSFLISLSGSGLCFAALDGKSLFYRDINRRHLVDRATTHAKHPHSFLNSSLCLGPNPCITL